MMYCRICGTWDNTQWYPSKRQTLCESCASTTPKKAGRRSFGLEYWGAGFEQVPHSTRDEFYSDYLSSECTIQEYKDQTTRSYE